MSRNRIGSHGCLNRAHEKTGLEVFDVDSGNAKLLVDLLYEMKELADRLVL
jgi:hypothetical protein